MAPSPHDAAAVQTLLEEGKAAYQAGKKAEAFYLVCQAIQRDPQNEIAWIWLSATVDLPAERRFCLEQALALNPHNEAVVRGLTRLPNDLPAQSPFPGRRNEQGQELCTFPGCSELVSRPGHIWCYPHWKRFKPASRQAERPVVDPSAQPKAMLASPGVVLPAATPSLLSATLLVERLDLRDHNINRLLADLGWLASERQGWIATERGKEVGAVQRFNGQNGTPFVLWPESILNNPILQGMVRSLNGEQLDQTKSGGERSFRERFPAQHRTADGHLVRSKAEMLIDNWLYMAGVVHAYERQLPIEEEAYCDFYIPSGKVYIEYWGYERDQRYLARRQEKVGLYQKYKFNLIELTDEHVRNLDDYLPRMLLKYGVMIN